MAVGVSADDYVRSSYGRSRWVCIKEAAMFGSEWHASSALSSVKSATIVFWAVG
jgi:hypothetical protein